MVSNGMEGGREGREGGREGRVGGRKRGREGREKGGEGEESYNDIHNITAFIKHSIDLKGFSHILSAISSLCLSPLISAFPPSLTPSYYRLSCIMLLLVSLILLFLILILIPLWNLMVI